MMDDTIDSAMNDDEAEEETSDLVNQVLFCSWTACLICLDQHICTPPWIDHICYIESPFSQC